MESNIEPIRIAHISMLGMRLSDSPGFKTQLAIEWRAAKSILSSGIDWSTVLLVPHDNDEDYSDFCVPVVRIPRICIGRVGRRYYLWAYVRRVARQADVVLVRHSVIDPFESLALRGLSNLAVVHHTKDVEELRAAGHPWLARIEAGLLRANQKWGRWPIGVTAELAQYATGPGSRAHSEMVLPNGIELAPEHTIDVDGDGKRAPFDVRVLFVASRFAPWHGLDRLLSALAEWAPLGEERLTLDLVGKLTDEQADAAALASGDRVRILCHGTLSREQIARLASRADVGVGSLALDRMGMKDACTLKVREYLAAGLPVYSTHRDSGLPNDFSYYCADSFVSIEHLIAFAMAMRSACRKHVRLAAEPYIAKQSIMRRAAGGMFREIRDHPDSSVS